MNEIGQILGYGIPLWVIICYYVFMSIVSGMPTPNDKDGKLYVWAFGTLHALSANLERARVGFAKGNGNGTLFGVKAPKLEPPKENDGK